MKFTLIAALVGIVICGKSSCTQAVKTKTGCRYLSKKKKPVAEFEKFGLLIPHVLTQ